MKPRLWRTRPIKQWDATAALFETLGFDVLAVPVLEIVPLDDPEQIQSVRARILDFDRYDFAIFVSQNAVEYGAAWLDDCWPELPWHSRFLAIGQATARALAQAGLPVVSEVPISSAMNSETLLALPELSDLHDKHVLIFRGLGGRDHLADSLRTRGAQVDYCELYRRELPAQAAAQVAEAVAQGPAWLSVHSGESLHNLHTLLEQQAPGDHWHAWPLLVPGERVAKQAQKLGFSQLLVAENATDTSMAACLQCALTGGRHGPDDVTDTSTARS